MTAEVKPEITFALRKFDLITDEQEEAAYQEWDEAIERWNWYFALSDLAWKNLPLKNRLFRHKLGWQFRWMDAINESR